MNPATTHGAFSWSELMTSEPEAAADFYGKILPWADNPMDMPTGPYRVQMIGEKPVAGIMAPPEPMPSAWTFYVTVKDVDETLAKAESLGAKRAFEPMDVPTVGRMAGFMDPQGAYIAIITYEPMEQDPDCDEPNFLDAFTTPGAFSWFSLQTSDVEAAKAFYGEVFGWNFLTMDMPTGPYTTIQVGETGVGGVTPPMAEGVPTHWGAYITVEDADATGAAAESAGGKMVMPPFDIPTVGRMTMIQDPTGGMINIVKYVPMEQPA